MYTIYGFIHPKPEYQKEVERLLTDLITPTRSEAGSLIYNLHKQADGTLFMYEAWESKAALDLHHQTPHMLAFFADFGSRTDVLLQSDIESYVSERVLGG